MPNVSQFRRPRSSRPEPLFLFDARRPVQGATTQMIEQVITHADQFTPLANGRRKLRISAAMVEQLQAQGRLGPDAYRLTEAFIDGTWKEKLAEVAAQRVAAGGA